MPLHLRCSTAVLSINAMEEVLLYTENIGLATSEIEAAGGRISIQMGDNLLITNLPAEVAANLERFQHSSAQVPSSASPATLSNVEVYKMQCAKKLKPQPKVQKWTERTAPMCFPQPESD